MVKLQQNPVEDRAQQVTLLEGQKGSRFDEASCCKGAEMQQQGMPGVAEVCACQKMKPVRAEAQDSRTRPSLPFSCSSEIHKCQSCRQHKCLGTRQEIDEGSASITYYGAFLDLLPHAQGINNFIIQGNCIKPHLPPARRIRLYRNLLLRASRTGSHAGVIPVCSCRCANSPGLQVHPASSKALQNQHCSTFDVTELTRQLQGSPQTLKSPDKQLRTADPDTAERKACSLLSVPAVFYLSSYCGVVS